MKRRQFKKLFKKHLHLKFTQSKLGVARPRDRKDYIKYVKKLEWERTKMLIEKLKPPMRWGCKIHDDNYAKFIIMPTA